MTSLTTYSHTAFALSNRPFSGSRDRPCFNGKERDYESGFHYYGARYYWSELLTGWLSVDPLADKYPGISPYAYCSWNPVKLVDPDGEEGIVVSGSPGNHANKRHFLDNGLNRAQNSKSHYQRAGEQTTWFIYNDSKNPTPDKLIKEYTNRAKKNGINVKVVSNVDDITNYINIKNGKGSRDNDRISSFYYLGHATPGDLDVGYQGTGENFDPGDLNSSAFCSGTHIDVVGGCRTAINDMFCGIKIESSIVDQFSKILDKKSQIHGSDVRVYYPGGVISNLKLLSKNNGHEIIKNGEL